MIRRLAWLIPLVFCCLARAQERPHTEDHKFDFSRAALNEPPPGCSNILFGEGKPGNWRVILDEVPLEPDPASTNAPAFGKKSVVAQLASDTTDEHYPLLILTNEIYSDFTFTTRFKIAGGRTEQMAGIAFRIQDESNFYVIRASALGHSLYFYPVERGLRLPESRTNLDISTGVWHELSVECQAEKIRVKLDGKPALQEITDLRFSKGKIGFWTKSDSISYFTDTDISYVPTEPYAQRLARETFAEYPHLIGLQIYALKHDAKHTQLIASTDGKDLGKVGEDTDDDVVNRGVKYYLKRRNEVIVTMPLCDRNGDPMAAVRVLLKPVAGQTQENAVIRALPVIKSMQDRVAMVKSLVE